MQKIGKWRVEIKLHNLSSIICQCYSNRCLSPRKHDNVKIISISRDPSADECGIIWCINTLKVQTSVLVVDRFV